MLPRSSRKPAIPCRSESLTVNRLCGLRYGNDDTKVIWSIGEAPDSAAVIREDGGGILPDRCRKRSFTVG